MKDNLRYIIFAVFVFLSFYITEKTALFVREKDPIIQSIKAYSLKNNYDAVNAEINDSYIIPGMYGKRVNEVKSLMNMKANNQFNSIFLDFSSIKPNVSLKDNKDKIIIKGNERKKAVSMILENDENNLTANIIAKNIPCSLLVNKDTVNNNPYFEQINNDFENYNYVEKQLNKNKINKNICILSRNNKEFCQRHKKYIVKPSLILNTINLVSVKSKVNGGDIILIKSNVIMDDLNYLIDYIKGKSLRIITLSELISEN